MSTKSQGKIVRKGRMIFFITEGATLVSPLNYVITMQQAPTGEEDRCTQCCADKCLTTGSLTKKNANL